MKVFVATIIACFLHPICGFVIDARQAKIPRALVLFEQSKVSYNEYRHDNIDPLTSNVDHHITVESRMSPTKRAIADEYWLDRLEDDKEKLQKLNEASSAAPRQEQTVEGIKSETWTHYREEYIDRLTKKEDEFHFEGHLDSDIRRANADKFWMAKFRDDKERLTKLQERDATP